MRKFPSPALLVLLRSGQVVIGILEREVYAQKWNGKELEVNYYVDFFVVLWHTFKRIQHAFNSGLNDVLDEGI